MRKLSSLLRRAVDDYKMIQSGDKIAVGLSGGKDSFALLAGLAKLREFYPSPFELCAVTVDMGFSGMDFSAVKTWCENLGVPYYIRKTEISSIVFNQRKESNPCSLCARMRRGALHDAVKSAGCNKLALGHHFDDVIETFFLSLFYEGRLHTFQPVTYLSRKDLTMIRPMIYAPEWAAESVAKRYALPIVTSTCPVDGHTRREEIKELISGTLAKNYKNVRNLVFGAIQRSELTGWSLPDGGTPRIAQLDRDDEA